MSMVFAMQVHAQDLPVDYSLTLRGLQVGNLQFEHNFEGEGYTAGASFETTGLAGALFDTQINAETTGTGIANGVYEPSKASIEITQHGNLSTQIISYEDGLMTNLTTEPRISTTLDPSKQTGAVDPLTAFAYVMRPVPMERLCKLNIRVFDGITATRVTLNQASQRPDGRFQCQGAFAREHGFSAEQLENEGGSFYFTALYRVDRETGDMVIDRIVGDSTYGQFQLLHNF